MKSVILISFIFAIIFANSTCLECPLCTKERNPQCGRDGVTYDNPCTLKCAGAFLDHYGECDQLPPDPCICDDTDEIKECGKDGITYSNQCERRCAGSLMKSKGDCPAMTAG